MQVLQGFTGWIGSILGHVRNGLFGGLDVHIEKVWPARERERPALYFGLWVERTIWAKVRIYAGSESGFKSLWSWRQSMPRQGKQAGRWSSPCPLASAPGRRVNESIRSSCTLTILSPRQAATIGGGIAALGRGGRRDKRRSFEREYSYRRAEADC